MNKLFVLLIIGVPLLCSLNAFAGNKEEKGEINQHIKRFALVDKNLYRGAQPDEKGLELLKEYGIKKIINLRGEKKLVERERAQVEALGMEYVNIPWTIWGTPYNPEIFARFFKAIRDKDTKPVFFHCKRGSERTGVLGAAYKIHYQDLSLDEALANAKQYDIKFIWWPFVKSKIKNFAEQYNQ